MLEYPEGFTSKLANRGVCGVLATAICADVSYDVARQTLKQVMIDQELGQRFRGGTYSKQRQEALKRLAVQFVERPEYVGMTIAHFAEFHARRDVVYMVCVKGHVVSVKNNAISDQRLIGNFIVHHSAKRRIVKPVLEILGKGWGEPIIAEPVQLVMPLEVKQEPVSIDRLGAFAQAVTDKRAAYFDKQGYKQANPVIGYRIGNKYAKMIAHDSGSIFCFVDLATGDILKAASFAAPAKGVRGNIANGAGDVDIYGARYLR